MRNKVYDIAKWVAILLLPALAWFYVEIAGDWNLPKPNEIAHTLNEIGTLLGLILGVSSIDYKYKQKEEEKKNEL